jgi:hypothetical protein
MNAAERDEKFLDCAGRVLGAVGARRLLDLAIGTVSLGNIAELARAMVPAQEPARTPRGEPSVLAK